MIFLADDYEYHWILWSFMSKFHLLVFVFRVIMMYSWWFFIITAYVGFVVLNFFYQHFWTHLTHVFRYCSSERMCWTRPFYISNAFDICDSLMLWFSLTKLLIFCLCALSITIIDYPRQSCSEDSNQWSFRFYHL